MRAELAQLRASLPDLIATALAVSGQRSAPSAPPVKSRADLKTAERTAILAALEAHAWNKTAAAAAVGMPIRTFYRRCEEYGIE